MARGLLSFQNVRSRTAPSRINAFRLVVFAGVLLCSFVLAYLLPESDLIYVIILLAGIAGALFLLKWPALGIILIIIGGVSVPDVGPKNINLPMVMVVVMTVLWVLDMVVRQRKLWIFPSRTMLPLLAFTIVSLLAFGFGQFSWFNFIQNAPLDAQAGGFAVFIISFLAFVLVANQVKDVKWLEAITWTFLGIGSLYICTRAVPGMGFIGGLAFQPQSIGGVFWGWFPTLAFSQMLLNRKLHLAWRIFLGAMVLGALYIGMTQNYDWKSGWVPGLIGIATVVALYSWRWGLFFGVIGAYPAYLQLLEAFVTDEYSVATRLDAWIILEQIIKVNPILGLGFANYYWYTPLFAIRGFAVRFNSHNNFVDIVAQTGLAGLACFLWLLIEVGLLGFRLLKLIPEGFARAFVYGALGGLVATVAAGMLGDWVLSFVYNIGLSGVRTGILAWIFLGGLVTLERIYIKGGIPPESGA
jgi:hypothetical protein